MRAVAEDCTGHVQQTDTLESLDQTATEAFAGDSSRRPDLRRHECERRRPVAVPVRRTLASDSSSIVKLAWPRPCRRTFRRGVLVHCANVAFVFLRVLPGFVWPIAVGDFVAQHAAATDRRDAVFEHRQTTIDRIRRRMMIDQRRRAATHGGQCADQRHSSRRFPACGPDPIATR